MLNFIANLLWFPLAGLWLSISFFISGIICFCTIIGIPLGLGCFRLAQAAVFPLGQRVMTTREADAIRARLRTGTI